MPILIQQAPLGHVVTALIVAGLGYLATLAVYRLYLSPLAKIPGPKLAAVSKWYEFYYEVILPGQYVFKIEELHKKYGKRMAFSVLHCSDSCEPFRIWRRTAITNCIH